MRKNENYFHFSGNRSSVVIKYLKYLRIFAFAQKIKKIAPKVLTIGYFCAKIGIVKGFFTKNENDFQKQSKFSQKAPRK